MTTRPLKVEFLDSVEIRMGSPYNHCRIKLNGDTKIKLEDTWWQDKCAWNNYNSKLALVKWDLTDNDPGFHIVVIDLATGQKSESARIFGCLNSIVFKTDKQIAINKFKYIGKKTADGELIGNYDEVIEID